MRLVRPGDSGQQPTRIVVEAGGIAQRIGRTHATSHSVVSKGRGVLMLWIVGIAKRVDHGLEITGRVVAESCDVAQRIGDPLSFTLRRVADVRSPACDRGDLLRNRERTRVTIGV